MTPDGAVERGDVIDLDGTAFVVLYVNPCRAAIRPRDREHVKVRRRDGTVWTFSRLAPITNITSHPTGARVVGRVRLPREPRRPRARIRQ